MAVAAVAASGATRVSAEALLLIEAESGKVLYAENATFPWYPASLTKLMTAYIVLHSVKEQRLTLDSLLTVSQFASVQKPAKMGLKPGMQVTVDNALKMLMVRSANDVAVVVAEGISGSVEKFADEMNLAAARRGMTQSSFVNPNGMPAEDQISSARDLAILTRALIREYPEYDMYWHIPAIRYGTKTTQNYNKLLGRYPGTDGMKTGFICASGFNLVATATRNNRRLIAVVLGSASSASRTNKAALLLERGFNGAGIAWLAPTLGTVETLPAINATPPDLRETICSPGRKKPAAENEDDDDVVANKDNKDNKDNNGDEQNAQQPPNAQQQFKLSNLGPAHAKPSALLLGAKVDATPIEVYVGPSRKPAESQFATARAKLYGTKKPTPTPKPGKSTAVPAAQLAVAPSVSNPAAQSDQQTDNTPPWMAFAPTSRPAAEPAPGPDMPVPRPRPKHQPNGR
jgi:D-alanyl-D-alanine carboxypeptidase